MKKCQKCENEFPDDYLFCPKCGGKFSTHELAGFKDIDDADLMIAGYDLHKSYLMGKNAVNALRGVDLKVKIGDFVSIMGPSGSGKSTLMHLLGGLDRPSRGHIVIRHSAGSHEKKGLLQDISNLSKEALSEIRLHVSGFVFQQFYLLPTLSAAENISIPLIFSGNKSSFVKQRTDQLLELVGLSMRGHHLPSELSGGEQQRVAMARALANDPPLILADEPTGDLDSRTGHMIMKMLKNLNEMGKTIVMVTHDQNVASFARIKYEMMDGKFVDNSK